jgi:hypothetical protein
VLHDVHLHSAVRIDVLANLRIHLAPVPPDTRIEKPPERREMFVELF